MENNIQIFTDGGARGNPGPAASAFIIKSGSQRIFQDALYIGNSTNNVAEYTAVLKALQWLAKNTPLNDIQTINFFIDSQLVVNQLNGLFKIKNENLKKIILLIKALENNFSAKINYQYVPRNKNKDADFLVNKKLDENL